MISTVHVWWVQLTAADIRLADALPAAERARLDELAEPADRARKLLGSVLLQHAVAALRPGIGHPVEIDRTCENCGASHGRPVIAGGPHVSIAHAGMLVVVAASPDSPVGIDVERIDRFVDHPDPAAAARAWTRDEARLKALGGSGTTAGAPIDLEAPLRGYVAALHLCPRGELDLHIHHWPGG